MFLQVVAIFFEEVGKYAIYCVLRVRKLVKSPSKSAQWCKHVTFFHIATLKRQALPNSDWVCSHCMSVLLCMFLRFSVVSTSNKFVQGAGGSWEGLKTDDIHCKYIVNVKWLIHPNKTENKKWKKKWNVKRGSSDPPPIMTLSNTP